MNGWFIFTIILAVATLIVIPFAAWKPFRQNRTTTQEQADAANTTWRTWGKWTVASLGIIVLFFFFVSSCAGISTKNVGVETFGGATKGELSNGYHLKPAWYKVTEMNAAIQTDSYTGDKNCLPARIANQQTACVHISIRWRIHPEAATSLFKDYKNFDHVRDSLVTRELSAAVNNQLATYNPLNSVLGGTLPKGQQPNPPLSVVALRVTKQMQREIGDQIEVINTFIPIITFDDQTQQRINQLQQQIALTRIAQQEKITNEAKNEANNKLAKSVTTSPNVLVSTCLDILNLMVKQGQPVPPGFSCWPGGKLTGVIANSPSK